MDEIIATKADVSDKPYTLAGRKGFIHRYADTGFKTKWCGIWFPPLKFFEYFAFNINGEWLSPRNNEHLARKNGGVIHSFGTGGMGFEAEERVFAPKRLPAIVSMLSIKNTSDKKSNIEIVLEAAVNIRSKAENVHQRTYATSFSELRNAAVVRGGGNCAIFGLGKTKCRASVSFDAQGSYKDHAPGGEPSRCFIPGKYSVAIELDAGEAAELPFIFSGSLDGAADIFHGFDTCFKDWRAACISGQHEQQNSARIVTPDDEINRAFSDACAAMQGLVHDASFGTGLFAGYPWFLEFWGRDTFLGLLGLIDAGEFGEAKEIIRTMAQFQKKRMPCVVNLDRSTSYHGADIDALFFVALDYYLALSGDSEFEKELAENVAKSLDSLVLLNYLVQHGPEETWMDSLQRRATAVEIQSFWIEALRKREPEIAKKMHDKLIESFWNADDGYLYDSAGDVHNAKKTANALFPLMFGQLSGREAFSVLETAKKELASPYGIRTASKCDREYAPNSYHNGATWGFITAVAACAAFNYGKAQDGLEHLKSLAYDARRRLGNMSECMNPDTGELIGCSQQLWSSALFVHAVDAYLFGASYESESNRLVIAPLIPSDWKFMERKGKRAGGSVFDIYVLRTKSGYELEIKFNVMPEPVDAVIFLPEGVKEARANGKKVKAAGKSVELALEKTNSIRVDVLKR